MRCPHCLENFDEHWRVTQIGDDIDGPWTICATNCSACRRDIYFLANSHPPEWADETPSLELLAMELMIRPKAIARAPVPNEVPSQLSEVYKEACLVFPDSPKASAALSRRCLQSLLRDHARVKAGNLDTEIQQVLDSGNLPTDLAEDIDAVRVVGNFAAHPIKSTNTGEIIDVELGEAQWLLDTLEELFDFYFVRPAVRKAKRDFLNAKLKDAGKPPLK